jgi:hypothetical protein
LTKLNELLEKDAWKYEEFNIKDEQKHLLYNDFGFFYDYARDSLFNNKKNSFDTNEISYFYRKNQEIYSSKSYKINILTNQGNKTYDLEIEDITLRVFATGVAILSIELNNKKYEKFEDILKINEYGRRVYPQFIGINGICDTKNNFLANYIKIGDDEPEDFSSQTFEDIQIGNHIMQVLGGNTFTQIREIKDKFYIQPSLDDRMFVISWYGNNNKITELCTCNNYKSSDDWYKYVFVDGNGVTVQNEEMKKELLTKATYNRWYNYNTLYGITRYSFVLMTSDIPTLKKNNAFYLTEHIKTMYFQMISLLLANRTSILRFSDEVSALVMKKNDEDIDIYIKKIQSVYEKYLVYDSKLYFKEVTHQDQGIELYTMGMEQMNISDHHDKLDSKFKNLF